MSGGASTTNCYVIGIDFGTTYSGVAWCWSAQPDTIKLVTRWKTRLNHTSDSAKVPTEISYDTQSWGYDVPADPEPLRWFKLLLVPKQSLPKELARSQHIRQARRSAEKYNKSPVQVVADYLKLLWEHALRDIETSRGKSAVNGLPFKVWITIPAIWDDSMQNSMREAAKLAGIAKARAAGPTSIGLVAEPEAAALAVLAEFKDGPGVKAGDVFVVCDAGGGTVDLISYEVVQTTPMSVRECVQGEGKMCGAIFVDEAFEGMLRSTLGDRWDKISAENRKKMLNDEWEHGIKRLFDDSEEKTWHVALPLEAVKGGLFRRTSFNDPRSNQRIKDGQIPFARGHVRTFFGRVIGDIKGLLRQQINSVKSNMNGKTPKMILLVGGFGSSIYLRKEIEREFGCRGIQIVQPSEPGPWTAVCRGAVIRGLTDTSTAVQSAHGLRPAGPSIGSESPHSTRDSSANVMSEIARLGSPATHRSRLNNSPSILSRISRTNYGVAFVEKFVEGEHDERDKFWCHYELQDMADNQMDWYLKRGDEMYHKRPTTFSYFKRFESAAAMQVGITVTVYRNAEAAAPGRITDRVEKQERFVVPINDPFESFAQYVSRSGKVFRHVPYTLEMVSTGVTMEWRLYIRGQLYGTHDVHPKQAG